MTRLDMTKNPGNVEPIQCVLLMVQIDASASAISASVVAQSVRHKSSSIGIIPGAARLLSMSKTTSRTRDTPRQTNLQTGYRLLIRRAKEPPAATLLQTGSIDEYCLLDRRR